MTEDPIFKPIPPLADANFGDDFFDDGRESVCCLDSVHEGATTDFFNLQSQHQGTPAQGEGMWGHRENCPSVVSSATSSWKNLQSRARFALAKKLEESDDDDDVEFLGGNESDKAEFLGIETTLELCMTSDISRISTPSPTTQPPPALDDDVWADHTPQYENEGAGVCTDRTSEDEDHGHTNVRMFSFPVAATIPFGVTRRVPRWSSAGSTSSKSSESRYPKQTLWMPQSPFKTSRRKDLFSRLQKKAPVPKPEDVEQPPLAKPKVVITMPLLVATGMFFAVMFSSILVAVFPGIEKCLDETLPPTLLLRTGCFIRRQISPDFFDRFRLQGRSSNSKDDSTDPVATIAVLVDSMDGHLMDIVQDLIAMPSSLNISLSAHAAKSLALTVRSTLEDEKETGKDSPNPSSQSADSASGALSKFRPIAEGLDDLAAALNEVSDAVMAMSTSGQVSVRHMIRSLTNLFIAATGTTPNSSSRTNPPKPARAKNLQEMLDTVLEAIDADLADLEVRLHWVRERSEIAQAIWRQTEGAAEREAAKAKERRLQYLDAKDKHDNDPWKNFRSERHNSNVYQNLHLLRRTESDLEVLKGIVGELKTMAPSLIQLDTDLKLMRNDVQRLRGGLSGSAAVHAAKLMFGGARDCGELPWTDFLWEKIGRVEGRVGELRGHAPLVKSRE
ncbi:hypothetical protein HDU97_007262 [Phlyctochytrium planicorne]|nr:hypothetical protein HDU97_007262 [Phlyctochytrium planicorne]